MLPNHCKLLVMFMNAPDKFSFVASFRDVMVGQVCLTSTGPLTREVHHNLPLASFRFLHCEAFYAYDHQLTKPVPMLWYTLQIFKSQLTQMNDLL